MNNVVLIGRLVKDPEIRYTQNQMAVANFTLAIDRLVKKGDEKKTDFPRVTALGKTAEACEKYLFKGRMVAVRGRIQTGNYKNKNGDTVYTTDVLAEQVKFIEWGEKKPADADNMAALPDGFEEINDEDVPF